MYTHGGDEMKKIIIYIAILLSIFTIMTPEVSAAVTGDGYTTIGGDPAPAPTPQVKSTTAPATTEAPKKQKKAKKKTTEAPTTEVATTEIITTEIPVTEAPVTTEIATTEVITTEMITTEIITTELLSTEKQATKKESIKTEKKTNTTVKNKSNTGMIIGLSYGICAILFAIGILLKKKFF